MSGQPSISTREVDRALADLTKGAPAVREFAGQLTSEGVLSEAQQLAPIRSGDLRNSGTVVRRMKQWIIGFTIRYAAAVHERHETQSQYLRRPIAEHGPRIFVAAARKAFAERGGAR